MKYRCTEYIRISYYKPHTSLIKYRCTVSGVVSREVNLLDDHLVDVLLDSAAGGWNTVEREVRRVGFLGKGEGLVDVWVCLKIGDTHT
jgi:hypothetical protein